MKITYLLVTVMTMLTIACKKETLKIAETKETEPPVTASKPNCWGNFWQTDNFFYGHADNSTFNIPTSLVYNNKVYVFDAGTDLVRIYNGTSWQQVPSPIPFANNSLDRPNFGFTIGNKGYIGNLDIGSLTHPFWEYDFDANTWTQKTNFPGSRRVEGSAATFSIAGKGYVVGGLSEQNANAVTLQETWEYDPATNTWTQKANVPSTRRTAYASGFTLVDKGYVLAGQYITENSTVYLKKLTQYDPATDTWSSKTDFPGQARYHPSAFVIGSTTYAGCGRTINTFFKDFYKYNPFTNTWAQVADVPVSNASIFGFALNSKGYVEFTDPSANPNFLLKYTPYSCTYPMTTP